MLRNFEKERFNLLLSTLFVHIHSFSFIFCNKVQASAQLKFNVYNVNAKSYHVRRGDGEESRTKVVRYTDTKRMVREATAFAESRG